MGDVEGSTCDYTGGSVAGAVIGTFLTTLVLIAILHFLWTLRRKQRLKKSGLANLVIVEDGGKNFSYDNPGFMEDTSETKKGHETTDGMKVNGKGKEVPCQEGGKKSPWGPLSFFFKSRHALDDSVLDEPQTYNVSLRGHDFTGLGFNICGNMKDGIYVKDVMQRGPAAESKRVLPGDQIMGMTVSFKQIVLEDAITLLSYASPYEVSLEMVRLSDKVLPHKGIHLSPTASTGGTTDRICHPFFKSQSIDDLRKVGKEHLDLQIDRKKKANGLKGHSDARSSSSSTNMSSSKKPGKEENADEVESPKVKVITIKPSAMPRVKTKSVKAAAPVEAISPVVVNMTMEGSEMKEMKEVIEEVQTSSSEMLSMKPSHVQIQMDAPDSMTMMSEVEAPIKKPERTSKKDKMKDEMKKPMDEGEGTSKEMMSGKKMSTDKEMKGEGEEQSLFGKFGIKLPEISLSFGRKSGETAEKEMKKKKSDPSEIKMESKMSSMDEVDGDNVKVITIKPMPRDKNDEKRKAEEKIKEEKLKEERRKEKEEKMKEEKMKEEKMKEEKMKEEKIKEEKMKEEKRIKEEKMKEEKMKEEKLKEEKRLKDEKVKEEKMKEDKLKEEKKKEEKLKEEKLKEERMKEEKIKEEKRKEEKMKEEKLKEEKRKEEKLKEEKLKEERRKEEKLKEEKRKEEKLKEEKLKEEKRKEKEEKMLLKKKMSMKEKEMENERKEEEMRQKAESSMDEMDDKEMSDQQLNESKQKKPVFHIPSLGLKLPKFVHSKQTYSFENSAMEKEGKMEEGMVIPTTSSILDSPTETKVMKVEMMSSEEPCTSMTAETSMEEMKKSDSMEETKEGDMKETKGGFMSKGIKSLKDLKVKMTQKLNHDSESEEEEGEDGKKKKRDKSVEAKAREKMEKEDRAKERAKEKEKAKAEKKQKKELKKKLSTSSTSGSAGGQDPMSGNNDTSSSDESDSEEPPKKSGTKKLKKEKPSKEKGSKKDKMTKEKVKKSESMDGEMKSMEIEPATDMMIKEKSEKQMISKMMSEDEKMKKQSSSSSESSESDSGQKDSKPKKPKRSPKRKAPGPPMIEGKTITIAAEVMNPPKESMEEIKHPALVKCDSHKTPESGRKSASFGDLSSLQPKQVDTSSLLERAVSMDMASDENGSHGQMSQKTIPLMSPLEDLSAMTDSTTAMSQFKPKESLSSSSSSETLKASPTSIVHVFPKEQTHKVEMKEMEVKTDIQKMMEETVKTMNNIVHTMDEGGSKPTEVTVSGPSYSNSNTMEVGQVAQHAVNEIISTSERSLLTQSVQVVGDPPMSLTVDVGDMEMGNNVTVMQVMESSENDNEMIIGEGGVKMRRGDSKTRLMQTVADANEIKISPVSGNSRRDSSTSSASSTSSDSSPDMRGEKKANGGQMIEITSNELDGVMMSHAEFLARQNMEGGVAGEPTSFDTWVYVEQKSDEPVSSSSASDPSSNEDDDQPRNGALSPTTFKMETEYETSELRVTTSPLSDDPKQAKVYSTTMTLPQKTITQIVLGQDPGQPFSIVDGSTFSNGVIVSKITLDAKSPEEKRQEEMDSLPKLETLK